VKNPLGPKFDHVRWHLFTEVDRGMDELCWTSSRITMFRHGRPIWDELVGVRAEGQVHMHLCERGGEKNLCSNPQHIKLATQSENIAHCYELTRLAGRRFRVTSRSHT